MPQAVPNLDLLPRTCKEESQWTDARREMLGLKGSCCIYWLLAFWGGEHGIGTGNGCICAGIVLYTYFIEFSIKMYRCLQDMCFFPADS